MLREGSETVLKNWFPLPLALLSAFTVSVLFLLFFLFGEENLL